MNRLHHRGMSHPKNINFVYVTVVFHNMKKDVFENVASVCRKSVTNLKMYIV